MVNSGDAIVIRERATANAWLFGGLTAVFVLAFARGITGAQTQGGKVAVALFTGLMIVIIGGGWIARISRRATLIVAHDSISYITTNGDALILDRQSGDALKIVRTGSPRYGRTGLTIQVPRTTPMTILPITSFRIGQVRQACSAKGWQFLLAGQGTAR